MRTSIDRVSFVPAGVWLSRRPASLGEAFVWALLVAAGLRAFSYDATGLDWDESFYIVIAERWLHGAASFIAISGISTRWASRRYSRLAH